MIKSISNNFEFIVDFNMPNGTFSYSEFYISKNDKWIKEKMFLFFIYIDYEQAASIKPPETQLSSGRRIFNININIKMNLYRFWRI